MLELASLIPNYVSNFCRHLMGYST